MYPSFSPQGVEGAHLFSFFFFLLLFFFLLPFFSSVLAAGDSDQGCRMSCGAQTGHYQSGVNGLCAQYIQLFSDPREVPWVMAIIV